LANYRASDGHFVSSARPSLRSGVRPAAAAIFLVVTVEAGAEDDVRGLLADVAGLTRSVGFRRPDSDLSCVVGVGSALWDRLFVGPRPSGLHPFVELHGARHTAVATPGDLLFHLRARRLDVCFELARLLANRLAGHAHIVDEVHGFKYFDERDLMGFVDGTDIAPDVELDDVPAYVMISCSVMPGTVVPPASDWTADTAGVLQESMLEAVADWHPAAQALVRGLDLDSVFAIPFGFLEPAENWEPSRVTILGDAAHGMLPTLGMGANLALNDAALLTEQLDRYGRGEIDLFDAIGTYETQMREIAYPVLRMTLDHDKNFGGGGLAKAEGSGESS